MSSFLRLGAQEICAAPPEDDWCTALMAGVYPPPPAHLHPEHCHRNARDTYTNRSGKNTRQQRSKAMDGGVQVGVESSTTRLGRKHSCCDRDGVFAQQPSLTEKALGLLTYQFVCQLTSCHQTAMWGDTDKKAPTLQTAVITVRTYRVSYGCSGRGADCFFLTLILGELLSSHSNTDLMQAVKVPSDGGDCTT